MFRHLVLGLLRHGGARHGYALMKEYRNRSGLEISSGNFYRELQRLVTEGLVRTRRNPPDADPRRMPYEITPAGVAAFDAWLAGSILAGTDHEDQLSARALFLAEANDELARRVLARWREDLSLYGKTLERAREQALQARSDAPPFNARPELLSRRLKHVASDLEFVDELLAALPRPGSPKRRARGGATPLPTRARLRGATER